MITTNEDGDHYYVRNERVFVRVAMAAIKESPVGVRLTRRDADPQNLGRLEALFDELDINKDGVLDSGELIAGIKKKGYTHITEEQIKVRETCRILDVKCIFTSMPSLIRLSIYIICMSLILSSAVLLSKMSMGELRDVHDFPMG